VFEDVDWGRQWGHRGYRDSENQRKLHRLPAAADTLTTGLLCFFDERTRKSRDKSSQLVRH
jgi:hypothetical protein